MVGYLSQVKNLVPRFAFQELAQNFVPAGRGLYLTLYPILFYPNLTYPVKERPRLHLELIGLYDSGNFKAYQRMSTRVSV